MKFFNKLNIVLFFNQHIINLKNLFSNLNQKQNKKKKLHQPGIEPGTAAWKHTTVPEKKTN
jgi:hypothetical protein